MCLPSVYITACDRISQAFLLHICILQVNKYWRWERSGNPPSASFVCLRNAVPQQEGPSHMPGKNALYQTCGTHPLVCLWYTVYMSNCTFSLPVRLCLLSSENWVWAYSWGSCISITLRERFSIIHTCTSTDEHTVSESAYAYQSIQLLDSVRLHLCLLHVRIADRIKNGGPYRCCFSSF